MPEKSAEYVPPPEGWLTFGSLIDHNGPAECSEEVGEDGLPLWERPIPGQWEADATPHIDGGLAADIEVITPPGSQGGAS